MSFLLDTDPEIKRLIDFELGRQREHIELIASENFTSRAVMEACGSVLTNKYAEGLPGKRFYGGCQFVDEVETLAIERAKQLFGTEFANVQPHSGAQANMAVQLALLKPGDTIMGLNLSHGGHLTHGSPANFSGIYFNVIDYKLDEKTGRLDYDEIEKLAKQHKPKMIICGASAYPRTIDFAKFGQIAKEVGAYLMADIAHIAGLVVTGNHPTPVGIADFVTTTTHKTLRGPRGGLILFNGEERGKVLNRSVFPGIQGGPLMHVIAGKAVAFKEALDPSFKTYQDQVVKNAQAMAGRLMERGFNLVSGGTDNHLTLIDLTNKNINGRDASNLLESVYVTANKNTVPGEKLSPFVTSGIRLGTPAATARGMKEAQMVLIADIIADIIENPTSETVKEKSKKTVHEIVSEFPLYA